MRKLQSLFLLLSLYIGITPVAAQSVTSFTLINADSDLPIRTLVNGDIINYGALPTRNLNIRANTNPAIVGSVVFVLDGARKVENIPPYAIAGDYVRNSGVDYLPITPPLAAGAHVLTATAHTAGGGGGTAGQTYTINFTVIESSSNIPPTANAGPDKTITLPTNSTTLNGSGSDADGSIASYSWTKTNGPSATLSGANTPTLSLSNLVAGVYVLRLTVTDNGGATAFDEATVTVLSGGSGNTPAITSLTLINADNNQDIRTLTNGDVLNYSLLPTMNLNIRANTNPSTVGSVVFVLDGNRKVENVPPYTYAGDNVSGSNVNYNKINPPLAAGSHTLNVTAYTSANGGGTAGSTFAIAFSVSGVTSNIPPTANAGPDKTLTLPANSTTLNGSGSDPDGSIASYQWTKQSGPSATLSNANSATLSVSNMVAGTYVFRLTVTDNQGATGFDDAVVTVNASGTGGGGGSSCPVFNEQNGLVVIEIESRPVTADWSLRTNVSGYTGTGYYEWRHGNTNTSVIPAGTGILTYTIRINNPGRYKLQIRSAAPHRTEYNDVWARFPEGRGTGVRGTSNLNLGANWFKVYHNVSNNAWTWETKTKDHDPHDIFVDFPAAGTYRVEFSGRSTQFKMDRFVLYNSSVDNATANSAANPQSSCAGSNKTDDMTATETTTQVFAYPNPSAGSVTFDFNVEQAGRTFLRIFDTKGALLESVFDGNLEAGEMKRVVFDGSQLSKGIYIARLVTVDKVITKQIVIH